MGLNHVEEVIQHQRVGCLHCFLIILVASSHSYVYSLVGLDHPADLTCSVFLHFPPQIYSACILMFLLSIHGGIQLGKYSMYNTLCLQLTFLINCNRNTAISSLIAGRIQLYISSLSRIQKLWLPNFQRESGCGREVSI